MSDSCSFFFFAFSDFMSDFLSDFLSDFMSDFDVRCNFKSPSDPSIFDVRFHVLFYVMSDFLSNLMFYFTFDFDV